MTNPTDFERTLDRWMNDGPTVVADRVIAAALTEIPTTRQRGARWMPLKELFVTMKPAAMMVGLAAVIIIGVAAYQFISGGGPSIGGPEPARLVDASELPDIIVTPGTEPTGMNHDGTVEGDRILLRPIISVEGSDAISYLEQPGFVAGRYSEFSDDVSGLLSWAALFETVDDAERARALYAEEVQSADGYALDKIVDVPFGDEGASYDADPEDSVQVYLWRTGNLLLAAATYGEFDPDQLRSVAEQMDERAR